MEEAVACRVNPGFVHHRLLFESTENISRRDNAFAGVPIIVCVVAIIVFGFVAAAVIVVAAVVVVVVIVFIVVVVVFIAVFFV